jgi:hypothetical protein
MAWLAAYGVDCAGVGAWSEVGEHVVAELADRVDGWVVDGLRGWSLEMCGLVEQLDRGCMRLRSDRAGVEHRMFQVGDEVGGGG